MLMWPTVNMSLTPPLHLFQRFTYFLINVFGGFFLPFFKLFIDDSVAMTPFYLLLGKHREQENQDSLSRLPDETTPLPRGSVAIKEVGSSTPGRVFVAFRSIGVSHVLGFVSLLCIKVFFLFSQLLQTPAHVLPSTSYLCSMFIRSLLVSVTDGRSVAHEHRVQVFLNNGSLKTEARVVVVYRFKDVLIMWFKVSLSNLRSAV